MSLDSCNKALTHYSSGNFSSALKQIDICKRRLKKQLKNKNVSNTTKLSYANILRIEALIFISKRHLSRAKQNLKASLSYLGDDRSSKILRAQLEYSFGLIFVLERKNNESLEYFIKSKDIFLSIKEYDTAIDIIQKIADFSLDLKKFSDAEKYYKELEQLSGKIKDKEKRNAIKFHAKMGIIRKMQLTGEIEPAKRVLKKLQKKMHKSKKYEELCEILVELSDLEVDLDNIENAIEYLNEARDIAKFIDSDQFLGTIYSKLGILLLKDGQFKNGQDNLLLGLKFRTKSGDKRGSAQTLMELARLSLITSRNEDDLKRSESLINQSIDLFEKIQDDSLSHAMALEIASSIYTKLENYQTAIQHAKTSLSLFRKFNDKIAEARLLTQLGVIYDKINSQEKMPVLEKALKIYTDLNYELGVAEVKHLVAMHYLNHDKKKSLALLNECLKIYESVSEKTPSVGPIIEILKKQISDL